MPRKPISSMHVATVRSKHGGRTYASIHLMQSYWDEQGRVQKETLANLTPLPDEAIELIRGVLRGRKYAASTRSCSSRR